MADRVLRQIMALYRWLVEEEVAGAATTDADHSRYMNGIIHPCFRLEGKNLKSNFDFVKNILGERINDVIKVVPSDVWFEIFRRFPAADLFSLKAVCKTFHRLISDNLFARMHLNDFTKLHPNATRAIIISTCKPSHLNYYDPDTLTLSVDEGRFHDWCSHVYSTAFGSPLITPISRDRVLDSYHGLLLVQICDRLLLCNPITRSYRFLPSIRISSLEFVFFKIVYDNVLKQYKVFGLCHTVYMVSVYVLDVRRDGALHPPRETTVMKVPVGSQVIDYLIKESVSVNGNVHWLMIKAEQERWGSCIVSANVTTEEVKTRICSFTELNIRLKYVKFFAANGKFYLGRSFVPDELQLWVLEGVDSENPNPSWMINNRVALTLSTGYHTHVLGMFRDKLLIMITRHAYLLYQYDMTSAEFKMVTVASGGNDIEFESSNFISCRVIQHIDSLICL